MEGTEIKDDHYYLQKLEVALSDLKKAVNEAVRSGYDGDIEIDQDIMTLSKMINVTNGVLTFNKIIKKQEK